jgi:protein required for attachment to host cells
LTQVKAQRCGGNQTAPIYPQPRSRSMHIPSSLILLVSAHEVKLLRQPGSGSEIVEIAHLSSRHLHDNHTHSGTVPPLSSGARHGGDPSQGADEKAHGIVVAHAIDALRAEWSEGGYDRIVISAPDKLLGLLRKAMPADIARHVSAGLDKDLVKTPAHDLAGHLGAALRF